MNAELWQQQLHPTPAVLIGAAGDVMRARMLEYHGRMMARAREAEFLERMRESRIPELSASQLDMLQRARAGSQMQSSCQKWSAEIAKARKQAAEVDDWSVLDDEGQLEVIADYGQPIEEQALS